jgi:hypothetical protein
MRKDFMEAAWTMDWAAGLRALFVSAFRWSASGSFAVNMNIKRVDRNEEKGETKLLRERQPLLTGNRRSLFCLGLANQ